MFALLACWAADATSLWPVLLGAGVVTAVEGVVTVEQAIGHPAAGFLFGSRLSAPLGYPDATAALFMTMAWLMLGLASRAWLPLPCAAWRPASWDCSSRSASSPRAEAPCTRCRRSPSPT